MEKKAMGSRMEGGLGPQRAAVGWLGLHANLPVAKRSDSMKQGGAEHTLIIYGRILPPPPAPLQSVPTLCAPWAAGRRVRFDRAVVMLWWW